MYFCTIISQQKMSATKRVRDESGAVYDISEDVLKTHRVAARAAPKLTPGEHMLRGHIATARGRVDPVYEQYLEAIETFRKNYNASSPAPMYVDELAPGVVKLLQDDGFLVTPCSRMDYVGSRYQRVETSKVSASVSLVNRVADTL